MRMVAAARFALASRAYETREGLLLYAAAGILLAGCAASIPEKPIVQTVEVKVPVAVPCRVTLPERPVWELDKTSPDAALLDLAKAAVIEIKQRRAYTAELEAAAKSCTN